MLFRSVSHGPLTWLEAACATSGISRGGRRPTASLWRCTATRVGSATEGAPSLDVCRRLDLTDHVTRGEFRLDEGANDARATASRRGRRAPLRPGAGPCDPHHPPATWRLVPGRAGYRCEVPGCRNRMRLDVHHVHAREFGGTHDPRGLVCLCDGHHRAVHRGDLAVERSREPWGGPAPGRATREAVRPAHPRRPCHTTRSA